MKDIPTPAHLSERSKKLWQSIVPRRAKSLERQILLQTALEALDRSDEAREELKNQGLIEKKKNGILKHEKPLLKIERENRQFFLKCWKQLDLHWEHRSGANSKDEFMEMNLLK